MMSAYKFRIFMVRMELNTYWNACISNEILITVTLYRHKIVFLMAIINIKCCDRKQIIVLATNDYLQKQDERYNRCYISIKFGLE